jgi:hypothetical protein
MTMQVELGKFIENPTQTNVLAIKFHILLCHPYSKVVDNMKYGDQV